MYLMYYLCKVHIFLFRRWVEKWLPFAISFHSIPEKIFIVTEKCDVRIFAMRTAYTFVMNHLKLILLSVSGDIYMTINISSSP